MTQGIIAKIKKYTNFLLHAMINKPRVPYVAGFSGHFNLGDEALFQAIEKLFHKCCLLKYPCRSHLQKVAIKLFPVAQYAILAGGTIINQLESWRHLAVEYMEICPNFLVFGTGVAHPSFWSRMGGWKDTLKDWKLILDRCSYVGVRGPMSAELLINAGVSNVEVIGDPILTFAAGQLPENTPYITDSIGLNIGQARGCLWGSEDYICAEYVKLAALAKKAGWRVKWFVVYPPDLPITQKVAKLSDTAEGIHEIYCSHQKYLELVRPLSIFVGMKLHAVALATCAFVPSIMLEYQPKCRDYMQSIGQDDAVVRTDKFKAEEIWKIGCTWNSNRQAASEALYHAIKPLRNRQQSKAEELMQTLTALTKLRKV